MICVILKITNIKPNTFPGSAASQSKNVTVQSEYSVVSCGLGCLLLPILLKSYSVEFVNLLYTVHQGSQCYRIVQSLSVQVVLPDQHHRGGGSECVQGQAG